MTCVLAPLAGFTDAPFRRMCFEGGADLAYTEMVSAAALAHGHGPTHQLMETMPGEGPVACQIFGSNESDVALAAREVSQCRAPDGSHRFVAVDLNAGCPMAKVTRCGAGAALVNEPAKIGRLLKAIAENTDLPVTLKTRLGPHPQATTIFEILDAAEDAGVKGVTVHARYTSQMHGGMLHLDVLAQAVRRAHVPITGNGSVTDARTAADMMATGVSAIMIGRAALANPGIFDQLKKGSPVNPRESAIQSFERHLAYVLAFREQLARRFPNDRIPSADGFAAIKMHTHLFRYFNGQPGAAALRARLNQIRSLAQIRDLWFVIRGSSHLS